MFETSAKCNFAARLQLIWWWKDDCEICHLPRASTPVGKALDTATLVLMGNPRHHNREKEIIIHHQHHDYHRTCSWTRSTAPPPLYSRMNVWPRLDVRSGSNCSWFKSMRVILCKYRCICIMWLHLIDISQKSNDWLKHEYQHQQNCILEKQK